MGRPERKLDPSVGPKERFACELRELRRSAGGPSYRRLAQRGHYSSSTLAAAASGRILPTWEVTRAFVLACGGDEQEWALRWKVADATVAEPGAPSEISAPSDISATRAPATPPEHDHQTATDSVAEPRRVAPRQRRRRLIWPLTAALVIVVAVLAGVVLATTTRTILPGIAQASTSGQHIHINGDKQKSVQVCGKNQHGDEACETFNTPGYSTADPSMSWWIENVTIKAWTQPDKTGEYLGETSCFVPKSQDDKDWVPCNLPADGQGGTNGQHVYINGHRQKSVQVCGTNQRGDETCETFNASSYSTADPNEWWWVGRVDIRGWTQPDKTGEYLGETFCLVPKSQDGGSWVTCNTGW